MDTATKEQTSEEVTGGHEEFSDVQRLELRVGNGVIECIDDALGPGEVELSWGALAEASDYRVWKASVPDFSDEIFLGKTSGGATSYVVTGALLDSSPACYLVRALNSCNQEGP